MTKPVGSYEQSVAERLIARIESGKGPRSQAVRDIAAAWAGHRIVTLKPAQRPDVADRVANDDSFGPDDMVVL